MTRNCDFSTVLFAYLLFGFFFVPFLEAIGLAAGGGLDSGTFFLSFCWEFTSLQRMMLLPLLLEPLLLLLLLLKDTLVGVAGADRLAAAMAFLG